MTGVTVRTLHHYDQVGLVRPEGHTEGGQRSYSERDLLRLQQVIALRYLGFPLGQVRELLGKPDFDMVASLSAQKQALTDRIAELERARDAVTELLDDRMATGRWSAKLVAMASLVIRQNVKDRGNTLEKYYTKEQMAQFDELGGKIGEKKRKEVEAKWAELIAEVKEALGSDPASPRAQALARRWGELSAEMQALYAEYPDLWKAIGDNYRAGNFDNQPGVPGRDVGAFIEKARKAGG
jgi:DNA-binding transcriptional MerR regulator